MTFNQKQRRCLASGKPAHHRYPNLVPTWQQGGRVWVSSDDTYEGLLSFGDDPVAIQARARLDEVLNRLSRYSGEHDDAHAGAMRTLWCLRNPEDPGAAHSLKCARKQFT